MSLDAIFSVCRKAKIVRTMGVTSVDVRLATLSNSCQFEISSFERGLIVLWHIQRRSVVRVNFCEVYESIT